MSDGSTASLVFFLLSHLSAEEKEEKQQIKIYVFDFSLFFDVGGPTCEDNVCLYVRVCVRVNSGHNLLKAWQSVHCTRISCQGKCVFIEV